MTKKTKAAGHRKITDQEQKARRIELLNCQLMACQRELEVATEQFAFAQATLAEARDNLEAAHQALERVALEN